MEDNSMGIFFLVVLVTVTAMIDAHFITRQHNVLNQTITTHCGGLAN